MTRPQSIYLSFEARVHSLLYRRITRQNSGTIDKPAICPFARHDYTCMHGNRDNNSQYCYVVIFIPYICSLLWPVYTWCNKLVNSCALSCVFHLSTMMTRAYGTRVWGTLKQLIIIFWEMLCFCNIDTVILIDSIIRSHFHTISICLSSWPVYTVATRL